MTDPIDLKALAGAKYRIALDPSAGAEPSRAERPWYYRIPCKYGFIGVHGPKALMAYCKARLVISRLIALPGVAVKQRGDHEVNVTFPPERLDAVADLLQARRRIILSDAERARRTELVTRAWASRNPKANPPDVARADDPAKAREKRS
jgi:hypothetical protein